jgi:hypothetical protein
MIKSYADYVLFFCDACGYPITGGRGVVHYTDELVDAHAITCAAPPCADVRPERTVLGERWSSMSLRAWVDLLRRAARP